MFGVWPRGLPKSPALFRGSVASAASLAAGAAVVPVARQLRQMSQQSQIANASNSPLPSFPLFASSSRSYSTEFKLPLHFDSAYSKRSTCSLISAYSVLKSCSNPLILKHGPAILEKAGPLATLPTKLTYYKYFVGGETTEDCFGAVESLVNEGVGVVLDYSVEGLAQESQAELLTRELISSIEYSGKINQMFNKKVCRFGCIKLTGIANTSLLEKLSRILEYLSCEGVEHGITSQEEKLRLARQWIPSSIFVDGYLLTPKRSQSFQFSGVKPQDIPKFSEEEVAELDRLAQRLRRICQACHENGIPLLVDAEQSYYQAAVDYLSMLMQIEFTSSKDDPQSFALIYNTYQNYLKDAKARMIHDHSFVVQNQGKKFAAKVVRGAYMNHERARASKLQISDPIHTTIQDTHNSYNSSIEFGLSHVDNMSLFIATHNVDTLIKTTDLIVNRYQNIRPTDDSVMFAQLYGMGDSLTLALADAGFNVVKYIPYGPVHEVMPYLSRRLTENGDIFSGSAIETRRIAQELKSRIPFF